MKHMTESKNVFSYKEKYEHDLALDMQKTPSQRLKLAFELSEFYIKLNKAGKNVRKKY